MPPEAAYYHALLQARDRGYSTLARLYRDHGSWQIAWEKVASHIDPAAAWTELGRSGLQLLLREDPAFPDLLREIPHPPLGLYFKGTWPLNRDCFAIVGTRKATEMGRVLARDFASGLAPYFVIVSGLALGIDAASHEGALHVGGTCVAVLPCGLDRIYPRTNLTLAERILAAGGALISEYAPTVEPLPHRFLERNRIVSGLSRGVLVVEATERSGSLATARFASDQNREVFVVPGPVRHPNYRGSHALIRSGAELVTCPQDILLAYGLASEASPAPGRAAELADLERQILATLEASAGGLEVDKIAELTHLKAHVVLQNLSYLQIKGFVREDEQGYVSTHMLK